VSEEREHAGPGWLTTLFGGLVLVILGFGLGLVVGAAREEPELVLRHFSGESQEVPAPAASPTTPAPAATSGEVPPKATALPAPPSKEPAPVAPPAGAGPASARPAAEAAKPAAPPPTAPPVSSPPPSHGQRFSVQVGAFAERLEAEKLADRLRHQGMHVLVVPATGPRDSRWRVRVGPIDSRAQANRVAEQLKTSDKLPTWVLAEGQ
jgi:DedD protein